MSITTEQGNIVVAIVNVAVSVGSVTPMIPLLGVIVIVNFHAAIATDLPFTITT
jgi:hypothetical protein